MATFVLVHGAFHGGWCYSRVADALRSHGHDVFVPVLSGVGERAHLASREINLSTHVRDVVDTLVREDLTDVVLCGHSYAGMVITGVAGQVPERIRTLFYLDAAVPEDGQALFDLRGSNARPTLIPALSGASFMVAPVSAAAFQVNPNDAEMVDRLSTPHPIACFTEPLNFTGKEDRVVNRTFVLADRYESNATRSAYAKVSGSAGWKTISIDCGHDVMLDDPKALTTLLLEELAR